MVKKDTEDWKTGKLEMSGTFQLGEGILEEGM